MLDTFSNFTSFQIVCRNFKDERTIFINRASWITFTYFYQLFSSLADALHLWRLLQTLIHLKKKKFFLRKFFLLMLQSITQQTFKELKRNCWPWLALCLYRFDHKDFESEIVSLFGMMKKKKTGKGKFCLSCDSKFQKFIFKAYPEAKLCHKNLHFSVYFVHENSI